MNAEPVSVTIEGENFLALATQHIGGREPLSVDARFEAFLGEVALEELTLEDSRTLRARVPAGLGPGWHTLSVVGPLGQRVELPRAYFASDGPLALLQARAALEQEQLLVGERTRLVLTVENVGGTSALGVTPVLSQEGEGRVELVSEPGPADVGAGGSASFTWELGATADGDVRFSVEARGHESELGAELRVAGVEAGPLRIRPLPGLLSARFLPLPTHVNLWQEFDVELEVTNPGGSTVFGVKLEATASLGLGQVALVSGPEPSSVDIPAGGHVVFRARLRGTGEGPCSFQAGARGVDETYGSEVVRLPVHSSTVTVQRSATLTGALSAPSQVAPGRLFNVVLTLTNTGSATAQGVLPTSPSVSSSAAVLDSAPSLSPVALAGGASTTFTWSYRAVEQGRVSFTASASGTDVNAGTPVSTGEVSSGEVSISEVELMRTDPFKDGSAFAQVFPYGGRLVLGPNRSGTRAVRVEPTGTVDSELSFSFPRDTADNSSQNTSPPRYSSIGATGCTPDTASCGPDNEDGRGFFFAGLMGTQEWLGIGGARSGGDLDYLYFAQQHEGVLDMRFLDLSDLLGSHTRGFSTALFFKDRLYLGFPDVGGSRPYLLVVKRLPTLAPGYQAAQGLDAEDLQAQNMPGIGQGGSPQNKALLQMIDTLVVFNDRLYLANNGGCVRSTTPTPRAWGSSTGDWASCTPALPAWSSRTSKTLSKTADLEPADKAVPQMAVFQGRLYLARNTTVGPQLFACTPARGGSSTDCDPGDWSLVAPNSVGDTLLTQFDNPANTDLTLLVATSRALYVGFNNPTQGTGLWRASGSTPGTRSDFTGAAGCSAAQHASGCEGLGGKGLGVGATRFFDGVASGLGGTEALYFTAGDGTSAVRLFHVAD